MILLAARLQAFSVVISRMLNVFYEPDNSVLQQKTLELMGYFFLVAGVTMIGQWLSPFLFSVTGEKMTRKLRAELFNSLVRKELAFFDDEVGGNHGADARPFRWGVLVQRRYEPHGCAARDAFSVSSAD